MSLVSSSSSSGGSTRSSSPTTSWTSSSGDHRDIDNEGRHLVHIILPSGHWVNVRGLRSLQATVFALVVRYGADSVQGNLEESRAAFLQRALGIAEDAGFWCQNLLWTKENGHVSGKNLLYYVSSSDFRGDKETFGYPSDQDVDEPMITSANALRVFDLASLHVIVCIPSHCARLAVYFLERPLAVFRPLRGSLAITLPISATQSCVRELSAESNDEIGFTTDNHPFGVPTPSEWRELWAMWDLVTTKMLPHDMLLQKPIDLRHKCLFYLGHIPTFVDMLLCKAIGGAPSEPAYFWRIFERGIDPHVDDPNTCHHSHSDVPEGDADWPLVGAVIEYRNAVRARLLRVYDELQSGSRPLTYTLARTLVMGLEHEGFHVETLLYMLIQRANTGMGTRPPPGFTCPPWALLASQWDAVRMPDMPTPVLGPATVVLGWDDPENEDNAGEVQGHQFGWDNESPKRTVAVSAFRAEWRPVSNGEYLRFWEAGGRKLEMPKSWVEEDGEVKVRTVYGPVPMAVAKCWPVLAAYDDLAEYARAKGGRLPTEPELRLFLDTYEVGHEGGGNVGFRNWHPVPATTGFADFAGRGSNGGVWEWSSTLFEGHDGLVPTKLFIGYSVDFFDGKHQVVLGASYATIPRLAGRRTLRNFYQHNYPYAWVGARVVYEV